MNLTGGRTTLILNICALVLAIIISIEGAYIIYHIFGWYNRSDWIASFVPVLVMFIIRNRGFSYAFLFLHILVALALFTTSRHVYLGTYKSYGAKYPIEDVGFFLFVSILCLAAYGIIVLIRAALALLNKSKRSVADNHD
ncbi:MAG: hypothetical protein KGZ91_17655 [Afipia sp.]|nr:hypothetical protein [Afipia sp.]WIG50376.1 MAG: hypothetical protein OJF48_001293 [Afipia sp.]